MESLECLCHLTTAEKGKSYGEHFLEKLKAEIPQRRFIHNTKVAKVKDFWTPEIVLETIYHFIVGELVPRDDLSKVFSKTKVRPLVRLTRNSLQHFSVEIYDKSLIEYVEHILRELDVVSGEQYSSNITYKN